MKICPECEQIFADEFEFLLHKTTINSDKVKSGEDDHLIIVHERIKK